MKVKSCLFIGHIQCTTASSRYTLQVIGRVLKGLFIPETIATPRGAYSCIWYRTYYYHSTVHSCSLWILLHDIRNVFLLIRKNLSPYKWSPKPFKILKPEKSSYVVHCTNYIFESVPIAFYSFLLSSSVVWHRSFLCQVTWPVIWFNKFSQTWGMYEEMVLAPVPADVWA